MAYNKKYAELGESVIDYVNDREDKIEASFNDVDTYINGVSQELNTFQNGWEGSITFKRYGDLVSIKGVLDKIGTATEGTLLTFIPVDFIPSLTVPVAVAKGNVPPFDSAFWFWIINNGALIIRTSGTIPANIDNAKVAINQVYTV